MRRDARVLCRDARLSLQVARPECSIRNGNVRGAVHPRRRSWFIPCVWGRKLGLDLLALERLHVGSHTHAPVDAPRRGPKLRPYHPPSTGLCAPYAAPPPFIAPAGLRQRSCRLCTQRRLCTAAADAARAATCKSLKPEGRSVAREARRRLCGVGRLRDASLMRRRRRPQETSLAADRRLVSGPRRRQPRLGASPGGPDQRRDVDVARRAGRGAAHPPLARQPQRANVVVHVDAAPLRSRAVVEGRQRRVVEPRAPPRTRERIAHPVQRRQMKGRRKSRRRQGRRPEPLGHFRPRRVVVVDEAARRRRRARAPRLGRGAAVVHHVPEGGCVHVEAPLLLEVGMS
mmetsp:Transcript_25140/g.86781  ORF Transcript_25140/g.86781 Transcript_25140/m.86781 type:complete len:344 (-) Transcript_25140:1286-2317(-)